MMPLFVKAPQGPNGMDLGPDWSGPGPLVELTRSAAAQNGADLLDRPAVGQLLVQQRVSVALREPLFHDSRLPQELCPVHASFCSLFY